MDSDKFIKHFAVDGPRFYTIFIPPIHLSEIQKQIYDWSETVEEEFFEADFPRLYVKLSENDDKVFREKFGEYIEELP